MNMISFVLVAAAIGGNGGSGGSGLLLATTKAKTDACPQLGSNCLNKTLKGMAAGGRSGPLQAYKACKSWKDKRDFAAKFELDADCSWLHAWEQENLVNQEDIARKSGPMYLWDVARVNGMSFDITSKQQQRLLMSMVSGCEVQHTKT